MKSSHRNLGAIIIGVIKEAWGGMSGTGVFVMNKAVVVAVKFNTVRHLRFKKREPNQTNLIFKNAST